MKSIKKFILTIYFTFIYIYDTLFGDCCNTYPEQKQNCIEFVTKDAFGDYIDWNIQTSMYEMMYPIYKSIDVDYLEEIARSIRMGNGKDRDLLDLCMSTQREALLHVLLDKDLIKKSDIKNEYDLKLLAQEKR